MHCRVLGWRVFRISGGFGCSFGQVRRGQGFAGCSGGWNSVNPGFGGRFGQVKWVPCRAQCWVGWYSVNPVVRAQSRPGEVGQCPAGCSGGWYSGFRGGMGAVTARRSGTGALLGVRRAGIPRIRGFWVQFRPGEAGPVRCPGFGGLDFRESRGLGCSFGQVKLGRRRAGCWVGWDSGFPGVWLQFRPGQARPVPYSVFGGLIFRDSGRAGRVSAHWTGEETGSTRSERIARPDSRESAGKVSAWAL